MMGTLSVVVKDTLWTEVFVWIRPTAKSSGWCLRALVKNSSNLTSNLTRISRILRYWYTLRTKCIATKASGTYTWSFVVEGPTCRIVLMNAVKVSARSTILKALLKLSRSATKVSRRLTIWIGEARVASR